MMPRWSPSCCTYLNKIVHSSTPDFHILVLHIFLQRRSTLPHPYPHEFQGLRKRIRVIRAGRTRVRTESRRRAGDLLPSRAYPCSVWPDCPSPLFPAICPALASILIAILAAKVSSPLPSNYPGMLDSKITNRIVERDIRTAINLG